MILQLALAACLATPGPGDVVAILLDEDLRVEDAAEQLSRTNPFPIQELFWILQGDEIPAAWTDGERDVFLTPRQERAIELALRGVERERCIDYLASLAETERGVETKATIVEVLGWMGTDRDLATLLLAAAPESERYLAPARLRLAFGAALEEIFERRPRQMESSLPWLFRNAHSGLRLEVVEQVEHGSLSEPLEVLSRMLGVHADFDVLVLQTMHVVALRPTVDASGTACRDVRGYLHDSDPACVRLACRTLGAMQDVEAISELIHLLDTDDPNLRRAAAYGLEVGTGLQFGENVLRWRSWFERERVWWEETAAERFQELANGDVVVAMRALVDVSERCLDRHELARGVGVALRRPERGIVLTAVAYLSRLGSKAVVPDLIPLLDQADEEVRDAAWRALVRLTGQRLGPDPAAWRAYHRAEAR